MRIARGQFVTLGSFLGLIITVCLSGWMLMTSIPIKPAAAQTPGMSFPMGEEPTVSEEEKAKKAERERAYRAAVGKIPDQKADDPWGNIRGNDTPAAKPPKKPAPQSGQTQR